LCDRAGTKAEKQTFADLERGNPELQEAHMSAFSGRWHAFATQFVAVLAIAVLAIAAALVLPAQTAFAQANPAEAFVQQNVNRGYEILNNHALSGAQRREQFKTFLLNLTDLKRIGMFTLGQYANGASPADIQAFQQAFQDYAVAVYQARLGKYTGQTLKVTGSEARAADDRPIITDMEVEGIWLALSERSDFGGFLQQHGGSIGALTDHLRVQADQVRAESTKSDGLG
jgi:phospholipid transport system substrate-binding protein